MEEGMDMMVMLVVLTNLYCLGTNRLANCIKVIALQGILLGLLPLIIHEGEITRRLWIQVALSTLSKGILFPWLLMRAMKKLEVKREVEPFVSNVASLLIGMLLLTVSLWLGQKLTLPWKMDSYYLVPTALFNLMIGLFVIISRKKALTQVLGFLIMENGIYTFGLTFAEAEPLLVEMGILLDVFMAVFVMGIVIYQINREFNHIDTDKLSQLKG